MQKIIIRNGFVTLQFKRPIIFDLPYKELRRLELEDERRLKEKKEIRTHVITSPRVFEHIKESCDKSIAEIGEIYRIIESINFYLGKKKAQSSFVLDELNAINNLISKKYSIEWQGIKGRLQKVLEKLEKNLSKGNEQERPKAAALLYSIREKLAERRRNLNEIRRWAERKKREYIKARNRWLKSWLEKALERTEEMILALKTFRELKDVIEWLQIDTEDMAEKLRKGIKRLRHALSKMPTKHKDIFLELTRELSFNLFNFNNRAIALINELRDHSIAGKIWFIANELEESSKYEPELKELSSNLREVENLMLKNNVDEARKILTECIKILESYDRKITL